MSVMVALEMEARPERRDELLQLFQDVLPDTRKRDGFIDITMFTDQDEPNKIMAVEYWETKAHFENYLAWRTEIGTLGEIVEKCLAEPSLRFFDDTGY